MAPTTPSTMSMINPDPVLLTSLLPMKPAIRPSTIQERMPMAKTPSKTSPVFKPEGRGASSGDVARARRERQGGGGVREHRSVVNDNSEFIDFLGRLVSPAAAPPGRRRFPSRPARTRISSPFERREACVMRFVGIGLLICGTRPQRRRARQLPARIIRGRSSSATATTGPPTSRGTIATRAAPRRPPATSRCASATGPG